MKQHLFNDILRSRDEDRVRRPIHARARPVGGDNLCEENALLCYDFRADALERPRPEPRVVRLAAPVLPKEKERRLPASTDAGEPPVFTWSEIEKVPLS